MEQLASGSNTDQNLESNKEEVDHVKDKSHWVNEWNFNSVRRFSSKDSHWELSTSVGIVDKLEHLHD